MTPFAWADPVKFRYYRAPRHNRETNTRKRALRDALAQVAGERVTSAEPLGRCDILLCKGDAYTRIGETLICNCCLALKDGYAVSVDV